MVVSVASFIDENSDSQNIISNQLDNANGIYSYLANTIGCQVGNAPACYSLLLDASSYIINETSTIWTTIGEGNIALVEGALFTGFGDVKVTLVWDTTSDIDLWVTDPFGETITYQNTTSQSGGFLDVDDVDGYGPENIFWATEAPAGSYTVQAHYYGDNGEGATNYTIQVQLGTEVQTFNGRLESEDDLNTVVNFNYANGKQHVEFFTSTEVTKITAPKNK